MNIVALAAVALTLGGIVSETLACTTIIVGKKASESGAIILARNDDAAIVSVVLPQATSARHGVQILGDMIEQSGAGEGFGVGFADTNEAWYLETASGHHWVAKCIPDDRYFVSANQGRLRELDKADTMNVMMSDDLIAFAKVTFWQQFGLWQRV